MSEQCKNEVLNTRSSPSLSTILSVAVTSLLIIIIHIIIIVVFTITMLNISCCNRHLTDSIFLLQFIISGKKSIILSTINAFIVYKTNSYYVVSLYNDDICNCNFLYS